MSNPEDDHTDLADSRRFQVAGGGGQGFIVVDTVTGRSWRSGNFMEQLVWRPMTFAGDVTLPP
jgi:hypothetical protein